MENKIKCEYPSCNKEGDHRHTLKLINEENSSADLPFCLYHYLIVISGRFEAKLHKIEAVPPTKEIPEGIPKRIEFELIGPIKNIELIEQVVGSIEAVKEFKLKNSKKDLNNS